MLRIAIASVLSLALSSCVVHRAQAFDKSGQWKDAPENVRKWFNSPIIKVCCSLADGITTEFEMRPDGYYVPVPWSEKPVRVPDERLILNLGNPVGQALIWYNEESQFIRCFIPGSGA